MAAVCRGTCRHSTLIVHTEIQIATLCRYIQIQGPDGGSSGSDTIMQAGIIERLTTCMPTAHVGRYMYAILSRPSVS